MAAIVPNNISVGPYPLPDTLEYIAGRGLDAIATPFGAVELRPSWKDVTLPERTLEAFVELLTNGTLSDRDDFIRTYEYFQLPITVIPTLSLEKLSKVYARPLEASLSGFPSGCILEDPNAESDPFRTFSETAEDGTEVEPEIELRNSENWAIDKISCPHINFANALGLNPTEIATASSNNTLGSPGVGLSITADLSGYFTEKHFFDREWILRYENALVKFSSDGSKFIRTEDIPKGVAFDSDVIDKPLPTGITYDNFYPETKDDAEILEAPLMDRYIRQATGIISRKGSEIRKLRFFFTIMVESYIAPVQYISPPYGTGTIPFETFDRGILTAAPFNLSLSVLEVLCPTIYTPILCHMTVNLDNTYSIDRFNYALTNVNTDPKPIILPSTGTINA